MKTRDKNGGLQEKFSNDLGSTSTHSLINLKSRVKGLGPQMQMSVLEMELNYLVEASNHE